MKKIIICLLLSTTLLTACASQKESNSINIDNNPNKEDIVNTTDVEENNNTTTDNLDQDSDKRIIDEVKDYILNGQQDKPEALKLKWSKSFLNEVDIESLYKEFLASSGTKGNVEEFAKYITENAPILNNWEELFKNDVYETYNEEIINIKYLEGDLYEGYINRDGVAVPYVVVSCRTGYYHGTSERDSALNTDTNVILSKEYYIEQLDTLKTNLEASADERYASSVTLDLIKVANDEYALWDDKLNEIYSVLTEQLPKDSMDKLTEEELAWINTRDEKAEAAAKIYEGGSLEPLNKVTSLIETTKERCYELVNNYME